MLRTVFLSIALVVHSRQESCLCSTDRQTVQQNATTSCSFCKLIPEPMVEFAHAIPRNPSWRKHQQLYRNRISFVCRVYWGNVRRRWIGGLASRVEDRKKDRWPVLSCYVMMADDARARVRGGANFEYFVSETGGLLTNSMQLCRPPAPASPELVSGTHPKSDVAHVSHVIPTALASGPL